MSHPHVGFYSKINLFLCQILWTVVCPSKTTPTAAVSLRAGRWVQGLTYVRRRRGTRAPCHRIGPNVTPTAPYALYAARGGGPGGLTIIAILDLLGGAAQCMVAAGPNAWDSVPATDACKWMALYGGLCVQQVDSDGGC